MPLTITIRDESVTGQSLHEWSLEVLTERITVRELIRSRVYQEVDDYNRKSAGERAYRGLVQPERQEATLNEGRHSAARTLDWKRQFEVALDAFDRNGFLILVDDVQPRSLDEEVVLRPGAQVSFVKLTPLVGG